MAKRTKDPQSIRTYPGSIKLIGFKITNPHSQIYQVRFDFQNAWADDAYLGAVRVIGHNRKDKPVCTDIAEVEITLVTSKPVSSKHIISGDIQHIHIYTDGTPAGTLRRPLLPFINNWKFFPA